VDAHLAPALLLKDFSPQQHINTWLQTTSIVYPALSLTVSGGHSHFSILSSKDKKELLGQSLDDACGEAFDKVSRLLGMGYPGGPFIEELAAQAEEHGLTEKYSFCQKFPDQKNRYNLSYSGLKTAVMEAIRKETGAMKGKITGKNLRLEQKQALAHSFQDAAILQLFNKTIYAIKDFPHIQSIIVAGGVAQNKKLRKMFLSIEKTVLFAPPSLCSDNATMIALQAFLDDKKNGFTEQAFSRYF
jgi:N6-L-threonylcarbamoyladenine synthase